MDFSNPAVAHPDQPSLIDSVTANLAGICPISPARLGTKHRARQRGLHPVFVVGKDGQRFRRHHFPEDADQTHRQIPTADPFGFLRPLEVPAHPHREPANLVLSWMTLAPPRSVRSSDAAPLPNSMCGDRTSPSQVRRTKPKGKGSLPRTICGTSPALRLNMLSAMWLTLNLFSSSQRGMDALRNLGPAQLILMYLGVSYCSFGALRSAPLS
jgi:hypothetical protein